MIEDDFTLASALGSSGGQVPGLNLAPALAAVTAASGGSVMPGPAGEAIAAALQSAFSIDLGRVLVEGWTKTEAVKRALEATKKDAAAEALVPLATHRMSTRQAPSVDLMPEGLPTINLPFELELAMILSGIELTIKGGKVVNIASGTLTGEAIIRFKLVEILKKTLKPFNLVGRKPMQPSQEQHDVAAAERVSQDTN